MFEVKSWLKIINWLTGVLWRTVVGYWCFDNLCWSHLQIQSYYFYYFICKSQCRNLTSMRNSPFALASLKTSLVSLRFSVSGFSQRTCFPLLSASLQSAACWELIELTYTTSTFSSRARSSYPSHLSGHIHKLLLFDRKHLFDREHLCTKKICGPKVMRLFIVQNFCLQRLL